MTYRIDHDYHIHTQLSRCSNDSNQTIERILQYARDIKLDEVCVTDHFWDENVEGANDWYMLQNYKYISSKIPFVNDTGIKLFFGCETELNKDMVLGISDVMMDKFDFIIIPTTHLHMTGFTVDRNDISVEARAEKYIERLDRVLNMSLPFKKIGIAHLTTDKIAYNHAFDWKEHIKIIDTIPTNVYKELFDKIAKKGAGVELNFDISKYHGEEIDRILRPYKIAKEAGCKFYLGSDAHHPDVFESSMNNFRQIVNALQLEQSDRFYFERTNVL